MQSKQYILAKRNLNEAIVRNHPELSILASVN